jgi:hypothetical protein
MLWKVRALKQTDDVARSPAAGRFVVDLPSIRYRFTFDCAAVPPQSKGDGRLMPWIA